jgi:glycosyltransferase involved in cell wall biosynthesis
LIRVILKNLKSEFSLIIFLGFNNLKIYKRGVENVIAFQSESTPYFKNIYIHWDIQNSIYRYNNLICIGLKKHIFWFISLNLILFKIKKKQKSLFIHSHNPLMSIVSLYKTKLLTVHDPLFYLMKSNKHKFYLIFWFLEKFLYIRCKHLHFISDFAKKMSFYKKNNFVIIPNTSIFEKFYLQNINDNRPIKFNVAKKKIFIVRSIEERALINLILECAQKLEYENYEFLIAGKGPLLEFYKKMIFNLNLKNIIFLGYVPDNDLINYYRDCDLVIVSAAYGEGFGLPIIEGYLFNKPVIASNICAIPEVIINNDFLFNNTLDSLVTKIKFTFNVEIINYREYYINNFSNLLISQKIKNLYSSLI